MNIITSDETDETDLRLSSNDANETNLKICEIREI